MIKDVRTHAEAVVKFLLQLHVFEHVSSLLLFFFLMCRIDVCSALSLRQ